jgi:hydrogenase-1 operon protein HyaF
MNNWTGHGESTDATALLRELVEMLRRLIEEDTPGHIDLMTAGLDESGFDQLRKALGEGDIYAQVADIGMIDVVETGYAGIWWVSHKDEEGHPLAEFIEVSFCPEVLIADVETVTDGYNAFRAHLFEMGIERRRR